MLKLSGEALKGKLAYGFDTAMLNIVAGKVKSLVARGYQCAVLIGGGNIYRGATGEKSGLDRVTADSIGMLATVMNSLALGDALKQLGQPTSVLSGIEMPRIAEFFSEEKADEYLNAGHVVICAAGTGNPFFSTDTSAVQKALELNCDLLIKGTKVDGVYDKDPVLYADAQRFETISMKHALEIGVNVMDHAAIALAMDNKLPMLVCKIEEVDKLDTPEMKGTNVTAE